jgi:hypothetical protein
MFNNDVARKCFIAECWAPNSQINTIQLALRKGSVSFFLLDLSDKIILLNRKQAAVEQYHQY